jgi:hypothetical protein
MLILFTIEKSLSADYADYTMKLESAD